MKQIVQLQIPEPCHENWHNMTETQQGRFCLSCSKEVVDFSVMSDTEILAYISTASSHICGRVKNEQLNRFIQSPRERKQYPFKYFWSVLITSFLISNESSGQVIPPKDTVVSLPVGQQIKGKTMIRMGGISNIRRAEETIWQISGRVIDENNNPVSYASVIIRGSTLGAATDSAGFFSVNAKGNLGKIELEISAVGFVNKVIGFDKADHIISLKAEKSTVAMRMADIMMTTQTLGGVVVVAGDCTKKGKMTVGLLSTVTRYTVTGSIKSILNRNEIKVYPNPIATNTVFKIGFNIKDFGEYALQFTDASGKIIAARQFNINVKNQLENFNGNMFNSSGIYFVTITGKQSSKMYATKLLVQ